MRALKIVMLLSILLSVTACSTGSCRGDSCATKWKDGGSGRYYHTQSNSNICSDCQCTDPNRGNNTCMSKRRYCEAFGNPGGR